MNATAIYNQINRLTSEILTTGLCDRYNFPLIINNN